MLGLMLGLKGTEITENTFKQALFHFGMLGLGKKFFFEEGGTIIALLVEHQNYVSRLGPK